MSGIAFTVLIPVVGIIRHPDQYKALKPDRRSKDLSGITEVKAFLRGSDDLYGLYQDKDVLRPLN